MRGFGKVLSTLLAASTPQQGPMTAKQVVSDFGAYYDRLRDGASVFQRASPTIKFNYVTPPTNEGETWQDDSVLNLDAFIMDEAVGARGILDGVANKYGDEKPIALYLPGLDGYGISAASWQFDDLSKAFELWRLTIDGDDRSSLGDVIRHVSDFCQQLPGDSQRPVYLIGESFGGLLAPGVALNLQTRVRQNAIASSPIKGMVMVNPATSFDKSNWDVLAPLLTMLEDLPINGRTNPPPFGLPSPYAVIGSVALGAIVPSSKQFDQIVDLILKFARPGADVQDFVGSVVDLFKMTAQNLSADIINHRIQKWLMTGASVINERLDTLDIPTLVLVGDNDKLLGSTEEAERLEGVLPQFEKLVVRGAGHFALDGAVNLTEAMIYSNLDPMNRKEGKAYDMINDWTVPSQEDIDTAYTTVVKSMETNFSPVYFSTMHDGTRINGIDGIPRGEHEGPLVFVANHQLLGQDLNLVVSKLLQDDLVVRGLGHPIIFADSKEPALGGRTPGLVPPKPDGSALQFQTSLGNFQKFGAVPVTPRNYYRLLQSGQNVLLFPGGVREVFHGRDEANQLFWPERVDFVRTAARFNATIVPLSAIGMAESSVRILDSSDILDLPVLGERARAFAANVTAARFDMANEDEVFLPPIVLPGAPSRNYFLFGKPVRTHDLDPKNKEECERVYKEIKSATQKGLDDLVKGRERDLFSDAPQRLAYERLVRARAPTIDASVLN